MSDARDFVLSRRFRQQSIRHNNAVKMAILKSNKFNGPDLQPVEHVQRSIVHK